MGERMRVKDARGIFANVLPEGQQFDPQLAPSKPASPKIRRMHEDVKELQEKGDTLDRLLQTGAQISEFDTSDISPSPVMDRFDGAYDEASIQDLIDSMGERGQISPGLVRPIGSTFQIVFGRRRLAAAKKLGIKFRAIVRELSDEEAIILQGEENANRNDLAYIEKCMFALAQIQAGFKREVVYTSLSTTKGRLSEMLTIADALPRRVLNLIGPVPDIGRRRWLDFAEAWKSCSDGIDRVEAALSKRAFKDDNERFSAALAALKNKSEVREGEGVEIRTNGFLLATATYPKSGPKLALSRAAPEGFMEYLTERMEELHTDFMKSKHKG